MASGRKKTFNEQVALNAAMDVFWQKGYAGTSITDLTKRMGINKPSLYNTFGNKETIFIKSIDNYVSQSDYDRDRLLGEQNTPLKRRLKNYMMAMLSRQCGHDNPKGCLLIQCRSEVLGENIPDNASRRLNLAGEGVQRRLEDLLKSDPEAEKLGLSEDASAIALCLATTLCGTASMTRTGKDLHELSFVIDRSLAGIGL